MRPTLDSSRSSIRDAPSIQPQTPSTPRRADVMSIASLTSPSYYTPPRPSRPSASTSRTTTDSSFQGRRRHRTRSPSTDSLPALTASSPATSSTYYTSGSSPPAATPPDSPIRSFVSQTTSKHYVEKSTKTPIKRCRDDTGLLMLLMALESEESPDSDAKETMGSRMLTSVESSSMLVKDEPIQEEEKPSTLSPLLLSTSR